MQCARTSQVAAQDQALVEEIQARPVSDGFEKEAKGIPAKGRRADASDARGRIRRVYRRRDYSPDATEPGACHKKISPSGRRFVKLHILVDVDTKKILAVRVTDDRTEDSPMFIPLFDDALKNCVLQPSESGHAGGSTRCSAYGDGAYASRDNQRACRDRSVTPLIKPKVSSTPKGKGAGDMWSMAVKD